MIRQLRDIYLRSQMVVDVELARRKESPYNPGEIVEIDGWPRWKTKVGPHELELDIVPVPKPESKFGIASFVVMEQNQDFLSHVSHLLAKEIASHTAEKEVLLMTVESKGSHFIPRVWDKLREGVRGGLQERIIVLRKGEPKVYMQRQAMINGREVVLLQISFRSITSPEEQTLAISPKDAEFLVKAMNEDTEAVFVDDFIGTGGTIVAVHKLFQQLGLKLGLKPPRLATVVGSDGDLYKETLAGLEITLLPHPFPLRLPTFVRISPDEPWQIK